MTDTNNASSNNNTNNTNNANSNTTGTTSNPAGKEVLIGCDVNDSNDSAVQDAVYQAVNAAGFKATKLPIAPNPFATASYDANNKGKLGVYLIAAGTNSITDFVFGGTTMDFAVFGIRGDIASQEAGREPGFSTKPIGSDPDCKGNCAEFSGLTFPQMNAKCNGRATIVGGATKEEIAQNVVKALGGQGSVSGTSQGGGAVLIPDKTFYGLIKQICGGVDGVFTIANNMAYLLSFKDIYEYRDKYDEFIPKIEASQILSNSLDKNWSTDGLYNTVEVTYRDGIVRYQNDALVQQYGQNIFYYEFPEDDEETAKAKADALLSAHIRDYGFDIYITTMYNPNITEGSWIKIPKKITNVSGFSKDEYEAEKDKKNDTKVGLITKKRKGLTISDITEIMSQTEWGTDKYIEKITDEEGATYEIEVEKEEYEMFFVNAYTLRWDKNHSLIMDLHLKFGPNTPEDPINATIGGGGAGNSSGTVGGEAADINAFVQKALQGVPNDEKSKTEAIYKAMVNVVRYSLYECSHYQTPSECLQNAAHLNCADSSRLGRACYSAGGLKAKVVFGPSHYWVQVSVNGQWIDSDVTGPEGGACVRGLGEVYNGMTATGECGDSPDC